jgi:hypothetical protein
MREKRLELTDRILDLEKIVTQTDICLKNGEKMSESHRLFLEVHKAKAKNIIRQTQNLLCKVEKLEEESLIELKREKHNETSRFEEGS